MAGHLLHRVAEVDLLPAALAESDVRVSRGVQVLPEPRTLEAEGNSTVGDGGFGVLGRCSLA
jgi:hypothetical protein